MTDRREETRSTEAVLGDLVRVVTDGVEGLEAAERLLHREPARTACREVGIQRRYQGMELERLMVDLGHQVPLDGNVMSTAHRAWLEFTRGVFEDDRAVLVECVHGERHTVRRYLEALARDLDDRSTRILAQHLADLVRSLDRFEGLFAEAVLEHQKERRREEIAVAHHLAIRPRPHPR